MKLRVGLVIVLLGCGCRPSPDASEPEQPSDERSPPIAWMAQPGGKTDPVYVAPSRPPREREQTAAIEGSPCELACADVHACVLEDGRSPSAAASIELGCLDGCVRAPDAFATCERPGSIGADTCAGYLECVRAAPQPRRWLFDLIKSFSTADWLARAAGLTEAQRQAFIKARGGGEEAIDPRTLAQRLGRGRR